VKHEDLLFHKESILAQSILLQGWMICLTEGADIDS